MLDMVGSLGWFWTDLFGFMVGACGCVNVIGIVGWFACYG